jgi:hypothetical protein
MIKEKNVLNCFMCFSIALSLICNSHNNTWRENHKENHERKKLVPLILNILHAHLGKAHKYHNWLLTNDETEIWNWHLTDCSYLNKGDVSTRSVFERLARFSKDDATSKTTCKWRDMPIYGCAHLWISNQGRREAINFGGCRHVLTNISILRFW